ncbi:MAG: Tat pathway signal protein [Coriobacteriaceae bacterium]|nr:MAG: Tat pathway signal protein [Coriobacteriaceae bacterium]
MRRDGARHSMTRRGLFRAGAAAGTAAAVIGVVAGCGRNTQSDSKSPTVVNDKSADYVIDPKTNKSKYKSVDSSLKASKEYTIATGNVLHAGEGTWLPVTTAGSSATPMVKGSALSIKTGELAEVVSKAYTKNDSNMVIYDVRCSDSVYAWSELDLLTHRWCLYAAAFSDGAISGDATTLWRANKNYDPPLFAVTGDRVIWLVMPSTTGTKTAKSSVCYVWTLGDSKARAAIESPGRFATEPAVSDGTVTLTPRVRADKGTYYGITAYKVSDSLSKQVDQLVLPSTVKPMNAVRIGDDFAFSIEASYDSGGLLGTMGSYIGHGDGPFVALSREPYAPIAGKDGTYVVKSRASYFVIDTDKRKYSVLSAKNRCVDYGEYPASMGSVDDFVTFSTIKDQDTGLPTSVSVRVFSL